MGAPDTLKGESPKNEVARTATRRKANVDNQLYHDQDGGLMSARSSSSLETEYQASKFDDQDQHRDSHAETTPNRAEIRTSLEPIRPTGLQNLVAIVPDGALKSKTFGLPDALDAATDWAFDQNTQGHNVYFTVNPVKTLVTKKPTKDDIAQAEYAHVDIDPDLSVGYADGRRRLLSETLPRLEAFTPPPSLIIDSGNGLGVFWRLASASHEATEAINKQLIAKFSGDTGTFNIDRLMRLPGTLNYPTTKKISKGYPQEPSFARLLSENAGVCSAEALAGALPPAEALSQPRRAGGRTSEPATSPAALSVEATQQAEARLGTMLTQDPILQRRWEGSDSGLNDVSRSGLDFSMAALLKGRGFTFSETAHLLTHCFEHGRGIENTERDLQRLWERSGGSPEAGTVRSWINSLYTVDDAAGEAGVSVREVSGLDPYSILMRGRETETQGDPRRIEADVVNRSHQKALETINLTFAKTMIGGKVAIIREFTDPSFGTPTYAVMAPPQLKEWYRGIVAYKVKKDAVEPTNLGDDWLNWPGQRRYRAMTFKPGAVDKDIYNGWSGFPIEPISGDWSLMQKLILEALCDGNAEYNEWLLDWMAVGVQQPTERYGVAAVLRGEKGVGKGQFAKWYGKLFGNHFLHLSNPQHLVGHFNAHLERTLLAFADELIWGGNKQQEGVLKALVTEEMIPIERKNWDTEMRKNYARLLVASNEDWVVPAGVGERRWFILDVSPKFMQDTEFFKNLDTQMKNGGLEAMMYDLMHREIRSKQRQAPRTKALADVAALGLDGVSGWLLEALSAGRLYPSNSVIGSASRMFIATRDDYEAKQNPTENRERHDRMEYLHGGRGSCESWPYAVSKDMLYQSYEAYVREHRHSGHNIGREAFFKKLKKHLPSAQESRPRFNGGQIKMMILPDLESARKEFNRTSRLEFTFEELLGEVA
ncbi:MAG: hypothetical protein KFB96_14695 [Thiocapsa sp.]|uniref:DUF5906 domain-containing protein n=1 Tax=Thiocapsa sp. TaxID=2024551 RepID=UPI001BCD389B|nr:DUF5906 domain-containing protein [Thiocapsa sp.]QVL46987.1 MAG: hypothetical protein KFB96_14695 [Thiocapsa sp.]